MPALAHRLDRTIVINAPREAVFRYFTDTPHWAAWWGAGSTIDARPGGKMYIRYPQGTEVAGEVIEAKAPERIVFTYGYVNGDPIPAGSSRITIQLATAGDATRLTLTHELADAEILERHVQGWRYQLSVFSNVVADEMNRGAASVVDSWYDSWAEPDTAVREKTFRAIAAANLSFHDRYSNISTLAELLPHVAAAQHYMPGIRMRRSGDVRHCQGTVLSDFVVVGPDGAQLGSGTNVFVFGPSGKIETATGFTNPAKA
jgi:uncharacterized protein YndB with AHSA1/START domain